MRPVAPELGRVAPALLEDVRRRCRSFRDEAFARWLGVDRTLVAHWRSGARPMPVEVLPLLAEYTGDPEAALGDLAARCGCRLIPDDQVEDRQPLQALREVRRHIGRLLERAEDATDPESPAGELVTQAEARELLHEAEALQEQLRSLTTGLRATTRGT